MKTQLLHVTLPLPALASLERHADDQWRYQMEEYRRTAAALIEEAINDGEPFDPTMQEKLSIHVGVLYPNTVARSSLVTFVDHLFVLIPDLLPFHESQIVQLAAEKTPTSAEGGLITLTVWRSKHYPCIFRWEKKESEYATA